MSLCTLQPPSKKILYFVFFIIFIYLKNLLEKKIDKIFSDKRALYFESTIFYTLGDLLCGFFALIVKKRTTNKKIESKPLKKKKIPSDKIDLVEQNALIYKEIEPPNKWISLKRVIYLSIFDLLAQSCSIIYRFIYNKDEYKLTHHNRNISLIFDIISRLILNKILLKIEFYPHYYLSISIGIISFGILSISDFYYIIPDHRVSHWINVAENILKIIFYSFENVEGKIGLNSEFLNPYNLLFYKGVFQSIILIISSLVFIILKKYYLFTGLFDNDEYKFTKKTFSIIIVYIIINMSANICIWKIIDSFTVQHLTIAKGGSFFVSYMDSLMRKNLDYQKKDKIKFFYFTDISGYFLLFIASLIHNEIIILNCGNLNKYTYMKLKEREEEDLKNDTLNTATTIKSEKSIDSQKSKKSSECLNYKNTNSVLNDSGEF